MKVTRPGESLMPHIVAAYRDSDEPSAFQRFFGLNYINAKGLKWYKGFIGERRTAKHLDKIPGATVLHSITVGSGGRDIDHLVVAPQGVFVINSKLRGKDVEVDGSIITTGNYREHLVKKIEDDARDIHKRLKGRGINNLRVKPIISFTAWAKFSVKSSHKNVVFVESKDIAKHIMSLPVDPKQQDALRRSAEALSDPNTWEFYRGGATEGLLAEFDGIIDELDSMHQRNLRWRIGGVLTVMGAGFAVATGMIVWAVQTALGIT